MQSETVENYLKAVLTLSQESPAGEAGVSRIAALVGVTPSTATTMVKRLAALRLARYQRYGAVTLTPKGRAAAIDVLRRHRIVELFLVQVVGLDWSEVHEEAERLEHAISPKVLDRLDAMLGRPEVDPHGDPIPDAAGASAPARLIPLSSCAAGERVTIARVRDQGREFLRFAAAAGLKPGASILVKRADRSAGSLILKPASHPQIAIAIAVADKFLTTP